MFIQHPELHEYMNCPSRPARGNISASNQQEEEQKPKLVRQELILAIWIWCIMWEEGKVSYIPEVWQKYK